MREPALPPSRPGEPGSQEACRTHHLPLEQAPRRYDVFKDKEDECVKVVLMPS